MDYLHWTEVNGVNTVWTQAEGPLRAGLIFRTGRVDETLITAGHTHLIEHMAMARMSNFTQTSNGFVSGPFTGFVTMGRPEDVSTFFRILCEDLASLPVNRLEAERKILLAEAAGRRYNLHDNLLIWRYGAAGYGLLGQPELGIRGAEIEQLQAWRNQRFTSGNAVLWLSGPVPEDLHLNLPLGEKQALPPLVPIPSTFPSWFVDDQCGGIAASTTIPRLSEAPIFHSIATKRMHDELRVKQALSYSPAGFYDPLNAETAHLVLFADSEQDRSAELAMAFGDIFEKLTEIDEHEVEAARKLYLDQLTGALAPPLAERLVLDVQRAAMDWLLDRSYETHDQLAEEARLVTADTVSSFAQLVRDNTILALPGKAVIQPFMGELIPFSAGNVVTGQQVRHADAPIITERLVVSPEGVSILYAPDFHITVRYDDLAAALMYDDGGMHLVSSDSTWLRIEPTLWRNGARICGEIRTKIPANMILEQGPRSKDDIPKPRTTAWQRFRALLR
jgi:zinc protease